MMAPDLFPTIPGVLATNGVAMNPPPASILDAVSKQVKDAVATLPPDGKGALVGVATTSGVNLALVHKAGEHVTVLGWIGKSWGQPLAGGAAVQIHW
jgi:hypothetical protein